mmetsp:Transcript_23187/g.37634  ORF Transcript_23187/g.37634 Transcript_23187/m.37634 type:complete len:434 (-) Transcript_23187:147-1448(-)
MDATALLAEEEDTSLSLCTLCCEKYISASSSECVVLSSCHHRSCRSCLCKWIKKEEASGQTTPPTCPFCRSAIGEEDVLVILGRLFQPREKLASHPEGDGEIDELTLHWINEHTVPCGACGSLIEKTDGCDKIECLCGYRFCYSCGLPGGNCGCDPGHSFLNDDEYIPDAPVRDGSGNVDIRSCILRRKIRWLREYRRDGREEEEWDRWDCSGNNAATCTSNGRWIFSSKKHTGCISMLFHQIGYEKVHYERQYNKEAQNNSNANHEVTWLFLHQGADIQALRQLLDRCDIQLRRLKHEWALEEETEWFERERDLNSIWLFLPDRAGFRILSGMNEALRNRRERERQVRTHQREIGDQYLSQIDVFIKSGAWLFQKPTGSSDHLVRLMRNSENSRKKETSFLWDNMFSEFSDRGRAEEEENECLESVLLLFPQ